MPTTTEIDGLACTLEKLADGSVRVSHESPAVNSMHGRGTGGNVSYTVHPIQRHQYEHLNALLPPAERSVPKSAIESRPWWSYVPTKKEQDKADDGE